MLFWSDVFLFLSVENFEEETERRSNNVVLDLNSSKATRSNDDVYRLYVLVVFVFYRHCFGCVRVLQAL